MNFQQMKTSVRQVSKDTMQKVNHFAKLERFIAVVLIFTPLILYLVDLKYRNGFRDSISNYFFMCERYWFGSLLTLAAALFIFNGAQHLSFQQSTNASFKSAERRFGKGYNIIFGLALFGVLFFNHISYVWLHYMFAVVFFVGCALAMIFTREPALNQFGNVLGTLTLLCLGIHFLLEYVIWKDYNPFTLLIAEWIGLILIAVYFIAESKQRDLREREEGIY